MTPTIVQEDKNMQPLQTVETITATLDENDVDTSSVIVRRNYLQSKNLNIKVLDTGNAVEFILPPGTAQFTEISVFDKTGRVIWKTQTFNENSIIWYKQMFYGGAVPTGDYTFHMKQGNKQTNGIAMVA